MSACHPFRPVPGQCGPRRRGPLPAPPFDPRDYWATRKCVSRLSASLEAKLAAKADLVEGKVPAAQLPSYVDDVLEYDTMSAFPASGESSKIYVAKDTNLVYRWSGTQYVEISPSPALDNTVTEGSPNGVKSSGIWSWVKSLLPHWLTSDYAEPATVASVADKRDKSDLAVYSVTSTENTDWRVDEVSGELADVFISDIGGVDKLDMPHHDEYYWYYGPLDIGGWHCDLPEESISELNPVSSTNRYTVYVKGGDEVGVRFARPRYMDETLGLAKQDQKLAAVATDDASKPSNGDLMKYDSANDRFVKAVEGTDYLKTHQDISGKFDATHDFDGENASLSWEAFYLAVRAPYGLYVLRGGMMADEHDELGRYVRTHSLFQKADRATTLAGYGITDGATKKDLAAKRDHGDFAVASGEKTPVKFGEWKFTGRDVQPGAVYSLRLTESELMDQWDLLEDGNLIDSAVYDKSVSKSVTEISPADWFNHSEITATRPRIVYVDGPDTLVGAKYVDGKVSAAVSTNNPAFVSAVQNTPAPEPGQGEDPPWGTWGTVGAAIAGLVEGLEWIKNILGSVASGYSTFAEWIASKYTKPSGGIPASDLALTVQSSLDAADAAAPQATTYTKDETDAAIRAGASLGQMTNLGNGRYEYTGALADASTQTYPREVA